MLHLVARTRGSALLANDVVELCEVLPRFVAVRTLDLSLNKIGPEGASALGEALKVNAVLTKLVIWGNNMGDAGKKALQDAVRGRSGFELML